MHMNAFICTRINLYAPEFNFDLQGSYDAYDLLKDDPEKQEALEYFTAKVYVYMSEKELESLGNIHNKVGHKVMVRHSIEIIHSLRRGWIAAGSLPKPSNNKDKDYRHMKESVFTMIEIKEPAQWNDYNCEWTLATTPSKFFNVLEKTFTKLEQGALLHQAGDRKKEEAAIAKQRKKQHKEEVSKYDL
jgi:hypothetical protein